MMLKMAMDNTVDAKYSCGSVPQQYVNNWRILLLQKRMSSAKVKRQRHSNVVIEIELLGWFPTINDSFVKLRGYWLEREIRATADADR